MQRRRRKGTGLAVGNWNSFSLIRIQWEAEILVEENRHRGVVRMLAGKQCERKVIR